MITIAVVLQMALISAIIRLIPAGRIAIFPIRALGVPRRCQGSSRAEQRSAQPVQEAAAPMHLSGRDVAIRQRHSIGLCRSILSHVEEPFRLPQMPIVGLSKTRSITTSGSTEA